MPDNKKLAIHGGKPVRDVYLPYGKQWIDDDDIKAVKNALNQDLITTGPTIAQFENTIKDFVGATYAVAFANGTAALHAACYAAGIKENDEVITTPLTFAASANTILYVGGKPVFADIDPKTYNISSESIKRLINERTKAIITVDFTGQPVQYEKILSLAEDYGIAVIADAAHALGARYKKDYVGSIADMTMFSFHPVKHITTGEGGIITTDDEDYDRQLRLFRSHGITREPRMLRKLEGAWYYEMQDLGYNYRMTDLQAALGLSQCNKLKTFLTRRRQIAEKYNVSFKEIAEITIPFQQQGCYSSWHLYIIRLHLEKLKVDRNTIFDALKAENIGVNVHYIPVYLHPYYQQLGYKKGLCLQAEQFYHDCITLPLFPKMSDQDVDDVVAGVKKVISYYANH
ncbi:UDP-4-amino-4,6-dideoxy-N-acetyl-beta-L-altrosamine transaminase [Roseburia sp. 1XD42-34]|nr:UDP-4-amino-4,6-dideoxy-N-acetyl-beta-L-altrosamine transaminase [Roseburia sp. 1XD42-34]NBJ68075.1 UDP-4-amino-4,6-dideoxy-N-acetyl-beta-L-altrosamine transaminase [Roseburia sp. 1XD42-34]RKI82516.1 UDP-4-amino-4,6-dideoxy-N-acetyl-beta-L-altrosamine transaminase [Clostridium sp. 1xD42-85]